MAKYTEREYRIGEYWLGQRSESPAWYRCWLEGGRVRRASLGTQSFEEAKERLASWFILNRKPEAEKADTVPLADVFSRYYDQHGKKARSVDQVRVGLNHWLDFWGEASVDDLKDVAQQEKFHGYLTAKMKASSAQRVITVGKAAINRAWKRNELVSVPYILPIKVPEAAPRGRPLSIEELRKLYAEAAPHLQKFILWCLGTASRPEAILQLHSIQIDEGLVFLNPVGRAQTKKYRPTVRMPAIDRVEGYQIAVDGKPVKSVKTAWKAAVRRAGLDDKVRPYSLRHTAARWMRANKVSMEDVALQLGHKRNGTTDIYTAFSPDYLAGAQKALNKLLRAITTPAPISANTVKD